jgi:hypothetical protein
VRFITDLVGSRVSQIPSIVEIPRKLPPDLLTRPATVLPKSVARTLPLCLPGKGDAPLHSDLFALRLCALELTKYFYV